ncbi:MAG: TetR/AcrR family transcriptional regulator [Actinomycetes bacterium]
MGRSETDVTPNVRDRVLDVALEFMSEHGAAGTSMRQIASACGVQVAAIYHYFDSKDALIAAVVNERRYGDRLREGLPVDPEGSAEDRLRQVFTSVWNGAIEEEAIWRLMIAEGIRGEPSVLPTGRDLIDLLTPALLGWVRQWVPEMEHPEATAQLMVGQLLMGFMRHVFNPELGADAIGDSCADALVEAAFA